jgi:hypothetical protein
MCSTGFLLETHFTYIKYERTNDLILEKGKLSVLWPIKCKIWTHSSTQSVF